MAKEETRVIILSPDGTATFERRFKLNGNPNEPARERVMETKRVDAASLIPDHGELMVLPTNCRFMRSEEGTAVFVTEESPAIRTVTWLTQSEETDYYERTLERLRRSQHNRLLGLSKQEFGRLLKTQKTFRLAFPYVIKMYAFNQRHFAGGWLYFRTKPLTSERDGLLVSCLPNLHVENGNMCLTDRVRAMTMGDMNYAQFVDAVDLEFWSSPWNDHWIETFNDYAKRVPEIASPWEWEYYSRVDSGFILRVPWRGWETTVGEQVRIRLAQRIEETDTFKFFETRVRAAEAYEIKPAVTDGATKPSPLERLFLNDSVILAIGDLISFRRKTFDSITTDRKYEIEWFGRSDRRGNRNVKLKGVEKPLPLVADGYLHNVVQIAPPTPLPPMELANGVIIGPGTIVRFKADNDWGDLGRCYFAVEEAKRGPRGVILVKFMGFVEPIPVGEFEELYPGVRLLAGKNGEEQTIELDDGTRLAVGDELAYCDGNKYLESRISRFSPVKNGTRKRTLVLEKGAELEVETDKGTFGSWLAKVADTRKDEIKVADVTIRKGDTFKTRSGNLTVEALAQFGADRLIFARGIGDTWVMLAQRGKFVSGVKPIIKPKVEDWKLILGHDVFEPGMAFFDQERTRVLIAVAFMIKDQTTVLLAGKNGTETEFAKDGELVPTLTRVDLTLALPDGREIHRGQRLRLTADIGYIKAGKRFVVSHIQRDAKRLVVLSEGLGFEATAETLANFEERLGTGWRPLTDKTEKPAPKPRKKVHPKFEELCAVRYLGGDASNKFIELGSEETAKSLSAKIVDWHEKDVAKVEFEERFPGTHCGKCGNCGGSCAWIGTKYLVKEAEIHPTKGETGIRVRYLGCGDGCDFVNYGTDEVARTIPATIVEWGKDKAICRFDETFGGLHNADGRYDEQLYHHIFPKDLALLDGPISVEFEHVFSRRRRGVRFALTMGTIVGRDARNFQIRIGDRVKIKKIGEEKGLDNGSISRRYEKGQRKFLAGAAFTVVHVGANTYRWLYLDAGEDIGAPMRRGSDEVCGYDKIPEDLRCDPKWWARIIFVKDDSTIVQDKGA